MEQSKGKPILGLLLLVVFFMMRAPAAHAGLAAGQPYTFVVSPSQVQPSYTYPADGAESRPGLYYKNCYSQQEYWACEAVKKEQGLTCLDTYNNPYTTAVIFRTEEEEAACQQQSAADSSINCISFASLADTYFSGNFIVVKESHLEFEGVGYPGYDRFVFKVFSAADGTLVNTFPITVFSGFGATQAVGIDEVSVYGDIGAFLFRHPIDSGYDSYGGSVTVLNLKTGDTLLTLNKTGDREYFNVFVDDEKVLIGGIQKSTGNQYNFFSSYQYKKGSLEEDVFVDISFVNPDRKIVQCAGSYVIHGDDLYDIINMETGEKIELDFSSYSSASSIYPAIATFFEQQFAKDINLLQLKSGNGSSLSGNGLRMDKDGNIYLMAKLYPDSYILRYNPFNGNIKIVYQENQENLSLSGFDLDGDILYLLLNAGANEVDFPVYARTWENVLEKEEFTMYTANGVPYRTADGSPITQVAGVGVSYSFDSASLNVFRMKKDGGSLIPVTTDFVIQPENFSYQGVHPFQAKNNSILLSSADAPDNMITAPATFKAEHNAQCMNLNNDYCSSCVCTEFTRENKEVDALFGVITGASAIFKTEPVIVVEPVVPARPDSPSRFREQSAFYRTYKFTAPDGEALPGVEILSASGHDSVADDEGISVVKNITGLSAGTYPDKTLTDIIASVSYGGNSYAFVQHPRYGGGNSFSFIVEPGGLYEKRFDLELGRSLSGGPGAFRFATVKAATADLKAEKVTGIYFNLVNEQGDVSLEMGRNIKTGVGVDATLAEAELMGGFSASAGTGISIAGIGAQSFRVKDPFDTANDQSRATTTLFIWDTMVQNHTLFFPGIGTIIEWLWTIAGGGDGLEQSKFLQSAGLQVEGAAGAGIDIPALEIAKGGTELSGENLNNLGLSLPSVSAGFMVEGYLHEYSDASSPEKTALSVGLTTEMEIDAGIFDGLYAFSGLPDLPEGHKATYGLSSSFDDSGTPHTLAMNYMTEKNNGDLIEISETELRLDAGELLANASLLPQTIYQAVNKENLDKLSWNTKALGTLYQKTIQAAAKGVSGQFSVFKDMVDETKFDFNIGLGAGLQFGVGASFAYLKHERALKKRYEIDGLTQGMAIVEDRTAFAPKFPDQTFSDIMGLTLAYLKDNAGSLFDTITETAATGAETAAGMGKSVFSWTAGAIGGGSQIMVSAFSPWSSNTGSTLNSVPYATRQALTQFAAADSNSATVGEAALLNVVDTGGDLVDPLPGGTVSFSYDDTDLSAVNLDSQHENDLYVWKFRSQDKKYARLGGVADSAAQTVSYYGIASNGIYGIGYDKTAPDVEFIVPDTAASGSMPSNQTIHLMITDDFSGVEPESITLLLDGQVIVDSQTIDSVFDLSHGRLLLDLKTEPVPGDHTLTVKVQDTAGNTGDTSVNFQVEAALNETDFDEDGVINVQDKFPFDPDYWQDDDNDGIPDAIDPDVSSAILTGCDCRARTGEPETAVDFVNAFVTFSDFTMTIHDIAILQPDNSYAYVWVDMVFDAAGGGFSLTGDYGQESDGEISCNCGQRENPEKGALIGSDTYMSTENAYGIFNYGNRLTIHDIGVLNPGTGAYAYFWLNLYVDLQTLIFPVMTGEFGVDL